MNLIRARVQLMEEKIAGYCEVCGAAGNHSHYDRDLSAEANVVALVCEDCVLPMLRAESALYLAGCAQPEVEA